jgi:hypothetical protein
MAGNAANAVTAIPEQATAFVNALGALLKYGAPGLALAILIVSFISLRGLQKQSLDGKVSSERIAPFVRLQRLYLMVSVGIFVMSIIAPPVLEHFFGPSVNVAHKVAFSMSPTRFEPEDLAPRVVVAGGGKLIAFRNGTAEDSVEGDKTYQVDFDGLVKAIGDLRFQYNALQLQLPALLGGDDARGNR